jgi:hypothetical protein
MVGVRLLPLPQHLIHLSSQFAAPKPNLPILGSYNNDDKRDQWSLRDMFSIKSVTCYFVAGILMGTAPASAQIQQPSPQAQFLARSLQQPQAQFLARSLRQEWHQQQAPDVVEPGLAVATTQIQQASPQAQVRS